VITNLQIKFIKSLHLKKNRLEYGQYVCEGEKIIHELIISQPESIDTIYACDSWKSPAQAKNLNIQLVSNKELERMSQHTTVPSVIALVNFPKSKNFKLNQQKFYLYIDQIADPGNLGTIIRTADWYGHKQIFLSPNCVDLYNQKVIQSAMGSHFRMQCFEIDFQQLIERHTFNHILATAMEGQALSEISDIRNSLIVLGSESHGVSEEIFKRCTKKITIPSFGQTESLNVAVAAGIIIHHFTMND
jgi:TrmH family RNA methyltransferase